MPPVRVLSGFRPSDPLRGPVARYPKVMSEKLDRIQASQWPLQSR
jgi:hypothetical protein